MGNSKFWRVSFHKKKKMEGKKLSKPLRSFTIALVEVVPLLIFSQLDFCFPACLLWSPVIREASASLRAVKVALESNATPCSAMIKGTQVRQPQRHIQLASKKVSRLPSHPSFPPAFLSPDYSDTERRNVEYIDQNKAKWSGFEDVGGSLFSPETFGQREFWDRGEGAG